MLRIDWQDLAPGIRAAVQRHTGTVQTARTVGDGLNSAVAAVLDTERAGRVFVKGLHRDHHQYVAQGREAAINPHVTPVAAPLLWSLDVAGWSLLAFRYLPGRAADYTPGCADLTQLVATMRTLATLPCPVLPQLKDHRRWADYVADPADLDILAGNTLLHTDYSPDNVVIGGDGARLIDWAWPTRAAAYIDPCYLVVRLVAAGHTPAQAEAVVADLPAWRTAPAGSIDLMAGVLVRCWAGIAEADPAGWKQEMARSARAWSAHRGS